MLRWHFIVKRNLQYSSKHEQILLPVKGEIVDKHKLYLLYKIVQYVWNFKTQQNLVIIFVTRQLRAEISYHHFMKADFYHAILKAENKLYLHFKICFFIYINYIPNDIPKRFLNITSYSKVYSHVGDYKVIFPLI